MRPRMVGLAILALGMAASTARPQPPAPDKPTAVERTDLDKKIVKAVYEAAVTGTDIFNKKNYEGCYRLYQGTLLAVQPLLDNRPKLGLSVKDKMDRAKLQPPAEGATTLRAALDEIMNDIAPQPPKTPPGFPGAAPETKTLWERLGGKNGVDTIVALVILQASENEKLKSLGVGKLDGKGIDKLRTEARDWVSSVTNGELKYEGKSLKDIFAGMKITNEQFDAFANIVDGVLKKQPNISTADARDFMGILESKRNDVVTVKGKG